MLLKVEPQMHLGVPDAPVSIREAPKSAQSWMGRRELAVQGQSAFELSFWCGTCPFLFEKVGEESARVTFDSYRERLEQGLGDVDFDVVKSLAALIPDGQYVPLLLEVTPERVTPQSDRDYFAHEQANTWTAPQADPGTDYYRTYEAPVSSEAHLYEFIVPMVPPSWNDEEIARTWTARLSTGARPTALALGVLDVSAPATDEGVDWYAHWGLTHFLLDGHHKMAAAASLGAPLTLLSLISVSSGISSVDELNIGLRTRAEVAAAPRAPIR